MRIWDGVRSYFYIFGLGIVEIRSIPFGKDLECIPLNRGCSRTSPSLKNKEEFSCDRASSCGCAGRAPRQQTAASCINVGRASVGGCILVRS